MVTREENEFYKLHFKKFTLILLICIFLLLALAFLVLYQLTHRPLPMFYAVNPKNQQLTLRAYAEPNQLPPTLIRFASKAAVVGYTYDFANYNEQLKLARPYFTEDGWRAYQAGVADLLAEVQKTQTFVTGVVAGQPVISAQGYEFGLGYKWDLQLPFLVTYQSAEQAIQKTYLIELTIVKVPTDINPQGIGIERFVMGGFSGGG